MANTTYDYSEKYNESIDMKINEETISLKDIYKVIVAFCRLTQVNYFKIKVFCMSINNLLKEIRKIL